MMDWYQRMQLRILTVDVGLYRKQQMLSNQAQEEYEILLH
jgi:hypothetical protein